MNYYSLICDGMQGMGKQEERVFEYAYLPRVSNPICGHELSWERDSIPLELKDVTELERWVCRALEAKVIFPESWSVVKSLIATKFENRGLAQPWIYPGLRLGPAQVYVAHSNWHYAQIGSAELFSQELVEALLEAGVVLPLVQEAIVQSKRPLRRKYFELTATRRVEMAETASMKLDRCPECGILKQLEYDRLVPRLAADDCPDFVRVRPTFTVLVSERVKTVVQRMAGNIMAVSSADIGVGPNALSLLERQANAEFDRQMRERNLGK